MTKQAADRRQRKKVRQKRFAKTWQQPAEDSIQLYKYRSLATEEQRGFLERVFIHREIYFARPTQFDDKYECRPELIYSAPKATKRKHARDHMRSRHPEMSRRQVWENAGPMLRNAEQDGGHTLRSKLQQLGILCLCEVNDSPAVWEEHADAHRGICLEFRIANRAHVDFQGRALKVDYVDLPPCINVHTTPWKDKVRRSLCTKLRKYEHEQEWRIVRDNAGVQTYPKGLLAGVILGARISAENREKVLAWVAAHQAPLRVYEAHRAVGRNAVAITQLCE